MTEVVHRIAELRQAMARRRFAGSEIGFVPTMGALHEGHVSLMRRSVIECDATVVSVFVNPLQFGPREDLSAYPRDFDRDVALAESAGVGLVFAPSVDEMYPEPLLTSVAVGEISEPFEGESRPTHFAGVTTVVSKLFNLVGPCRAYFGEKDWQQLAVVRRMVADLSFDVELIPCATVRERDGLALSSRNAYLGREERAAAPVLHRALRAGANAIEGGERDPARVVAWMTKVIDGEPLASLDYVAVVDATTLAAVPKPLRGELRLLGAARFGKARLIDNVGLSVR
jgi:pantoate--beta-alanine ligase